MPIYGNFQNRPVSWKPLPVERKLALYWPLWVEIWNSFQSPPFVPQCGNFDSHTVYWKWLPNIILCGSTTLLHQELACKSWICLQILFSSYTLFLDCFTCLCIFQWLCDWKYLFLWINIHVVLRNALWCTCRIVYCIVPPYVPWNVTGSSEALTLGLTQMPVNREGGVCWVWTTAFLLLDQRVALRSSNKWPHLKRLLTITFCSQILNQLLVSFNF